MDIREIQEKQGWSDSRLLELLEGWLMFTGQEADAARYIARVAKEEDNFGDDAEQEKE